VKKRIILLATSRKYGKYCVAGLDVGTGKLIRLITNDSGSHYAIDASQMTYPDGSLAQKLDLIEAELTDRSISYFQNENYIIRSSSKWQKLGTASLPEVLAKYNPLPCEHVFYDSTRRICKEKFANIPPEAICSLLLIRVEQAELVIQEGFGRRQAMISFTYNGQRYPALPVTDLEFMEQTADLEMGSRPMAGDPYLLCSVGECFEQDKCHYKIIASVFETQPSTEIWKNGQD